jgi:hypothetical protein
LCIIELYLTSTSTMKTKTNMFLRRLMLVYFVLVVGSENINFE